MIGQLPGKAGAWWRETPGLPEVPLSGQSPVRAILLLRRRVTAGVRIRPPDGEAPLLYRSHKDSRCSPGGPERNRKNQLRSAHKGSFPALLQLPRKQSFQGRNACRRYGKAGRGQRAWPVRGPARRPGKGIQSPTGISRSDGSVLFVNGYPGDDSGISNRTKEGSMPEKAASFR